MPIDIEKALKIYTGYTELFGSDTGSGYPKISNYPPTLVGIPVFSGL